MFSFFDCMEWKSLGDEMGWGKNPLQKKEFPAIMGRSDCLQSKKNRE